MAGKSEDSSRQRRKKIKKNVSDAVAHVYASFNNTIITITDRQGDVLCWASSGTAGFKGSRKAAPFPAQTAADAVGRLALDFGVKSLEIRITGPGAGRDSSVRALSALNMKVTLVQDVTPIPHNGCRPPKKRRI